MHNTWNTEERAGLGDSAGYIQRIISASKKRDDENSGNFDLYYFIPDFKDDQNDDKHDRTLLFCLGGPGRVLKPHDHLWFRELSLIGYKIVYFHLRGSGFSQLPETNEDDSYIRTTYAADDIDLIRETLVRDGLFSKNSENKWDAVIGYSYGAVLAQQYAHQYPNSLNKLILIGPISLDAFKKHPEKADEIYEKYTEEVREIRESVVDKIYKLRIFNDAQSDVHISPEDKQEIKNKLFGAQGVFKRIEDRFGSEQSVLDYWEVASKTHAGESLLATAKLPYPYRFFQALREINLYGERTDNDGAVNQEAKLAEIGEVIASAFEVLPKDSCKCHPQNAAIITNAPRSKRAFEAMAVYDGLSKRFIREWISSKGKDVEKCIRLAAGDAWTDEYPGRKVRIPPKLELEKMPIEPWSPVDHPHKKSTLILKGSADPVTAAGQAESYTKECVGPESIRLTFDGVGHEFILPGVPVNSDDIHPNLRGGNADTLNCLVYAFVEYDFEKFKSVAQPIWKELKAEEMHVTPEKPAPV